MLLELNPEQLEKAFKYLSNPEKETFPKDLEELHPLEWAVLEQFLESLLVEKASSPLH